MGEGLFSPSHLLIVAIIFVALFGYKKLPEITRSVGKSLRIFKTEMKGLSDDDEVRESAKLDSEPATAVSSAAPIAAPSVDEIARAQAVLAAAEVHSTARNPADPTPAAAIDGAQLTAPANGHVAGQPVVDAPKPTPESTSASR